MLEAIQRLDPSRATTVLSLAARKLLPQPQPADEHVADQADQAAADDVIKELSTKSRKPQDSTALQEALSTEISSFLLKSANSAEVRARVGDKGALSPSSYRVTFSPKFQNGRHFWGVSEQYALNAIAHCDEVQHFISTIEAPGANAHASLFIKIPPVKRDIYTIIVKCQRLGDSLLVDEAFRVYHDEIDMVGATTPLNVLERFVSKFGREIEVNIVGAENKKVMAPDRRKLFHEVIYNVPQGGSVIVNFPSGESLRGVNGEKGPIEIALCFAIDHQRYIQQLARHGVKAEVPQKSTSSFMLRNVKVP